MITVKGSLRARGSLCYASLQRQRPDSAARSPAAARQGKFLQVTQISLCPSHDVQTGARGRSVAVQSTSGKPGFGEWFGDLGGGVLDAIEQELEELKAVAVRLCDLAGFTL